MVRGLIMIVHGAAGGGGGGVTNEPTNRKRSPIMWRYNLWSVVSLSSNRRTVFYFNCNHFADGKAYVSKFKVKCI